MELDHHPEFTKIRKIQFNSRKFTSLACLFASSSSASLEKSEGMLTTSPIGVSPFSSDTNCTTTFGAGSAGGGVGGLFLSFSRYNFCRFGGGRRVVILPVGGAQNFNSVLL